MRTLTEILNDGEGHTIFKTEQVIEALKEFGFQVEKTKSRIKISQDGRKASFFLTLKPTKPPKSKYDVVSWNGDAPDGVWDLALIKALVDITGKRYDGGDYIGRGFQYRAYQEWLIKKRILGTPVKEKV